MTAWNGYPKNPDKNGLHILASKLRRNPTVYRWHADIGCYEDINGRTILWPTDVVDMTYYGSV